MDDSYRYEDGCYELTITIKQQALMKNVRALLVYQRLIEHGQIIHMKPSYETIERDPQFTGIFTITMMTQKKIEQLEILVQMPDIEHVFIQHEQQSLVEQAQPATRQLPLEIEDDMPSRIDSPPLLLLQPLPSERSQQTLEAFSYISTMPEAELRNMMRLMEELVIDQARLVSVNQLMNEHASHHTQSHIEQLNDVTNHLQRVISDLQLSVTNTYKRPIGQLFEPLNTQQHTEATFDIIGGELAVEESILRYLHPPLMTFLQEVAAQAVANVVINIQQIDNALILQIMMPLREHSCIDASIDALTEAIHERGTLQLEHVDSTMTVTLQLPLTASIMSALLIEFAQEVFAIPLTYVTEIIRIPTEDIQVVGEREVSIRRGQLLPLIRMSDQLRLAYERHPKKREIVIVAAIGNRQVGLVVDKMRSKQDVVMKPLSAYIGTPDYIAGATIIGNGDVAMILDISYILTQHGALFEEEEHVNTKTTQQLVTFMLEETEYGVVIEEVIDIVQVKALHALPNMERIQVGIVNVQEKTVPLLSLHTQLQLTNIRLTPSSRAIVTTHEGRDISFFVDSVKEVLAVEELTLEPLEPSHYHFSSFIKGVCNLDGRTILLLDFECLLNETYTTL